MTQFLLIHGTEQKTVTVEETADGGLIVRLNDEELFKLQPVVTDVSRSQTRRTIDPRVADLTGDPSHDYPLMLKRFRKNSYVLRAVAQYYKEKEGFSTTGIENMAQAEKDLELILPLLPKLIVNGQFTRGARAQIARKLDTKDAGGYRQRIDAVMWVALAEIEVTNDGEGHQLANNEASLGKSEDFLGNSEPKVDFPNKSTGFQKRRKSARK